MAHVRDVKNKKGRTSYQLVVELEAENGKRVRRYKTVKGTKKQANEALRKFQNELETGYAVNPSSMKLSDWMWTWLDQYLPNIEATTRSGYKDKIKNQINPYLGNIQLKALTPNTIQKWVNKLHKDQGLSPKTIRNAFLNLSAALEKAVVTQMIATNPCKGVELPKNQKYKAQIYTKQEIIQLVLLGDLQTKKFPTAFPLL